MQVPEEIDRLLKAIGVGVRPLNDPFLQESHGVCRVFEKLGVYHVDEEELCHPNMEEFSCNAPGCTALFKTLVDYELHYNGCHRYICGECKKTRPTARLLEIHIQETHDSFFMVLAEKQPMYQCFVSDCDLKFSSPQDRKEHCTNHHKFPKNYRYDESSREKSSKKQRKTKESEVKAVEEHPEHAMDVDPPKVASKGPRKQKPNIYKNQRTKTFIPAMKNPPPKPPDGPAASPPPPVPAASSKSSPSVLAFIPRQLTHKPYSKALTRGKQMEREVLESGTMMDLADALPQ